MSRKYVRKTHVVYSEHDLKKALGAVRDGHLSANDTAEQFKIPRTTYHDRLLGRLSDGRRGTKSILSHEEESLRVRFGQTTKRIDKTNKTNEEHSDERTKNKRSAMSTSVLVNS
jgi:hypothetical protein